MYKNGSNFTLWVQFPITCSRFDNNRSRTRCGNRIFSKTQSKMGKFGSQINILFLCLVLTCDFYGISYCTEDSTSQVSVTEVSSNVTSTSKSTSSSSPNNETEPEIATSTQQPPEMEASTQPPPEILLTDEEQEKLTKLRENILADLPHDYMKTDQYLVRWLVARDWKVEGAEQMLRNNLKWREEQNMDTIHEEDWSDMEADFPYTKDTVDKMGRPIGAMSIGVWNIRAASYAGKMQRLERYSNKLMEEATQGVYLKQQRGLNVTQWKVLMNMDGFGLRQHACASCLFFHQAFVTSYEEHYPGYADVFVLINTPATFRVVMEFIRPFLSTGTQKTVRVYGRNEKVWNEYLDQEIEKDQRRPEFGGTKEDPADETKNKHLYFKV